MSEESGAKGINVFISYADGDNKSDSDREVWRQLVSCLDALRAEGVIREWFCRAIDNNSADAAEIERLKRSDIVIFALGPSYLEQPERYRKVLRNLPESGRYLVFSLLLYSGAWHDSPFRRFNPLPSNKAPVAKSSDVQATFIEIKEAIRQARQAIYPERAKPPVVKRAEPPLVEKDRAGARRENDIEKEEASIVVLPPPGMEPRSASGDPPIVPAPSLPQPPRLDPPPAPPVALGPSPSPPEPQGPARRSEYSAPGSAPSPSPPERREPARKSGSGQPGAGESYTALSRRALEFERKRIVTEAARRADLRPDGDVQKDVVDCAIFAPPSAPRGGVIFVQVYASLREQADEALKMASEFDSEAKRRAVKSLEEAVARGTRLSFELTAPGLRCADPVQSIVWRGYPDAAQFAVEVPGDCPLGVYVGSVTVSAHSVPLGHIKFKLQVTELGSQTPANEATGEEAKRYNLAFISYASADRSKVLARVQMLDLVGIRYFQDVLSLGPGDRWEEAIYRNIDSCDLFLLFWSKAARESKWVLNEVRYAKKRRPPPEIRPVILEGPPVIAPPEDLNDLHFNDKLVYFILDQGR